MAAGFPIHLPKSEQFLRLEQVDLYPPGRYNESKFY